MLSLEHTQIIGKQHSRNEQASVNPPLTGTQILDKNNEVQLHLCAFGCTEETTEQSVQLHMCAL